MALLLPARSNPELVTAAPTPPPVPPPARPSTVARMMFNEFCETTGLHGWKYLTRVTGTDCSKSHPSSVIHDCMLQVKSGGKVLWLMIVLASLAVATVFIRASIQVHLLVHILTDAKAECKAFTVFTHHILYYIII